MAIPNNHIKIKLECRPCYVEGRKAMFHMWSSVQQLVPPSILNWGHNGGAVRSVLGIVEFEDGKVAQVRPEQIRFADGGDFHETMFVSGGDSHVGKESSSPEMPAE
jgi:hypothetical protein